MTPRDLIDDLRSRINPAYAATLGTESYERRISAETIEVLIEALEGLLRYHQEGDDGAELPREYWAPRYREAVERAEALVGATVLDGEGGGTGERK